MKSIRARLLGDFCTLLESSSIGYLLKCEYLLGALVSLRSLTMTV